MAYQCPICGRIATAAIYYHKCIDLNWYTVVSPAPARAKGPGKGPHSVPCPDGLLLCSDSKTRRDATVPKACTNDRPIKVSQVYCFDCGKVVYPPSPARRPVKRHDARK
jgi:hypothetical protein